MTTLHTCRWAHIEKVSDRYVLLVAQALGQFHPIVGTPDDPEGLLNWGEPQPTLEAAIAQGYAQARSQYASDSVAALRLG
jgi:hypothetical protein